MQNKMFLTPCKIGKLEIPNRILMAPMGTKADYDGGFSRRDWDYYEERAKGGTGMIITGRVAATEKYELRSHHVLDNYHQVGRLSILAERVHRHGTKLCIQIGPGVGRTQHENPFTPPYSASAVPSYYYPELICKPYTVEQIHFLAWSMGYTASLVRRAGGDAVEIHAYGGYLLDQFHSTLCNKRTDEYGGELKNRLRFTIECLQQIKEQAGEDFPVIIKYTANHHMEGGRELSDGVEMAKLFEEAGADALHVDGGCIATSGTSRSPPSTAPRSCWWTTSPPRRPPSASPSSATARSTPWTTWKRSSPRARWTSWPWAIRCSPIPTG